MALTCIAGKNGSVTLPTGHAAKIAAFSVIVSQEILDCSGFGEDDNWRVNLAGLKSWRGSASGYPEFDAANSAPALDSPVSAGSITLTATSGCTYSGTINISNITFGESNEGVATVAFDFVGSGPLSEAWDETA